MRDIVFAGPWITDEEVSYVSEAAAKGHYETWDKYILEFEKEAREYFGVKYAMGTHCATHALHLACAAIGLKKGDEVITTDHSWIATAYTITYTGAKCVFVDIDPMTLCIDPKCIEKAITRKTKAIMVVHNFGVPADMDEIMEIAKKHNLKVIEDAAPAMGSRYKGKLCGTIGDVGCISFHGAKIAVSQEGGLFLTNNEEIYKKAMLLSEMGRTDNPVPFWCDEIGYEYRIGSLPAAMATVQMKRINELVENKRKIYSWYENWFDENEKITMVKEKPGTLANYTYPAIWLNLKEDQYQTFDIANRIRLKLKDKKIHCRTGFPQMSYFPVYRKTKKYKNEIAGEFWYRGLVLPAPHRITSEEVDYVCSNLLELI
jgi:perosamine synthetase